MRISCRTGPPRSGGWTEEKHSRMRCQTNTPCCGGGGGRNQPRRATSLSGACAVWQNGHRVPAVAGLSGGDRRACRGRCGGAAALCLLGGAVRREARAAVAAAAWVPAPCAALPPPCPPWRSSTATTGSSPTPPRPPARWGPAAARSPALRCGPGLGGHALPCPVGQPLSAGGSPRSSFQASGPGDGARWRRPAAGLGSAPASPARETPGEGAEVASRGFASGVCPRSLPQREQPVSYFPRRPHKSEKQEVALSRGSQKVESH